MSDLILANNLMTKSGKLLIATALYALPHFAFANGETPVGAGLSYLIDAMYGQTGVAIATLAVMVVGLLCAAHYLKWETLAYTVIGVSIIFGAGAIVSALTKLVHHA
jgi:type IV secretory pathway VirB2 component (pilin)